MTKDVPDRSTSKKKELEESRLYMCSIYQSIEILILYFYTVFLMIWKRDRDHCVHKGPQKNDRQ